MDGVLLARIQFALTAGFHFIFPPLTIGLSWFILWLLLRYRATGDESYRRIAHFWTRLFVVSFAIGVATGITLEFEFGTNWGEYSRYVGDIFGAPLAAEGVLAFFLESTFIGILVFGWNRVSPRMLTFSSLMVAIGSTLSAFWIIVANSWQQTPAGYRIVGGRAEMANIWQAVFNPSTLPRYLHTIDASLTTAAFFVLGISAWLLLKRRHEPAARTSFEMAMVMALVTSVAQLAFGDYHATQVAKTQPEKLAAIEGLFETRDRAPLLVFGIPDRERGKVKAAIEAPIPGLLSVLIHGDPKGTVQGLNDFPKDEWPPLALTFYSFHLMVYIGVFLILFSVIGAALVLRRTAHKNRLLLRLAVFSLPLPFIANELGWIAAEVGRQPWIVYRLLKTSKAASMNVPAWQILLTTVLFVLIYSLLFGVWIFLLRRIIRQGPEEGNENETAEASV